MFAFFTEHASSQWNEMKWLKHAKVVEEKKQIWQEVKPYVLRFAFRWSEVYKYLSRVYVLVFVK